MGDPTAKKCCYCERCRRAGGYSHAAETAAPDDILERARAVAHEHCTRRVRENDCVGGGDKLHSPICFGLAHAIADAFEPALIAAHGAGQREMRERAHVEMLRYFAPGNHYPKAIAALPIATPTEPTRAAERHVIQDTGECVQWCPACRDARPSVVESAEAKRMRIALEGIEALDLADEPVISHIVARGLGRTPESASAGEPTTKPQRSGPDVDPVAGMVVRWARFSGGERDRPVHWAAESQRVLREDPFSNFPEENPGTVNWQMWVDGCYDIISAPRPSGSGGSERGSLEIRTDYQTPSGGGSEG